MKQGEARPCGIYICASQFKSIRVDYRVTVLLTLYELTVWITWLKTTYCNTNIELYKPGFVSIRKTQHEYATCFCVYCDLVIDGDCHRIADG